MRSFISLYFICSPDTINSEDRVRKGAEKLTKFLSAKQQGRLDGFFSVQPKTSPKKDKAKAKGKDKDDDKTKGKGKGTKRKVCSRVHV